MHTDVSWDDLENVDLEDGKEDGLITLRWIFERLGYENGTGTRLHLMVGFGISETLSCVTTGLV
jgi:hypothetical protein